MLRIWFLLVISLVVGPWLFSSLLRAQSVGHYLEGATGLENGSTPPPGFYGTYLGYVNPVNELKGPNGNTIIKPDITVAAQMAGYAMTFGKKVLGGNYGWSMLIPAVNTRFSADAFNISGESAGISDLYFAPVVLGWEKGKANFLLNYGFYAPSGSFDPSLALNPGLGFWEHQIQAGTTYTIDKTKLWNTSVLTTWEINQSKNRCRRKAGSDVHRRVQLRSPLLQIPDECRHRRCCLPEAQGRFGQRGRPTCRRSA